MRQPVQVSIYPVKITGNEREYLLLRRSPERGGFWQGVTGGVEGEESLWEAAKRELFEETGFSPTNLVQIGYSYALPMQDEWRKFYANGVQSITEHVFLAIIEGEQKPAITDEHDTWMWCSLTGALKKLQWPEYIQALKRCDLAVKSRF